MCPFATLMLLLLCMPMAKGGGGIESILAEYASLERTAVPGWLAGILLTSADSFDLPAPCEQQGIRYIL
jgi:hypothetical protein